jgi:LEA14-like dessication related protein
MKYLFSILVITMVIGCGKPQAPDYRDFRNFKIEKLGFNRSAVSMELVYYNPNNFGVQLRNIDCDVYIENNYLGKFQLDTMMNIRKKSEFILPAKVEIDMKNVFKNSLNLILQNEIAVKLTGNAKLGKAGVYFNVPVKYEGKHKLEF